MYDRLVWEVWMPFLRSAVWYECFSETELILIRFNLVNKNNKNFLIILFEIGVKCGRLFQ